MFDKELFWNSYLKEKKRQKNNKRIKKKQGHHQRMVTAIPIFRVSEKAGVMI